MSATQQLLRIDSTKIVVPFGDGTHNQFSHSDLQSFGDPSGISVEEGEFLYGLIRMVRPSQVLETGTNVGVSGSYICLAMQDNRLGHLTTIEHDGTVANLAREKLGKMGFTNFTIFEGEVANFLQPSPESVDFLWLDSELNQRFAELLRFYPSMAPGAIACIHDIWNLDFDEFGGVPPELRKLLRNGDLRAMTFKTSHGVTAFQKRRNSDYLAEISRNGVEFKMEDSQK